MEPELELHSVGWNEKSGHREWLLQAPNHAPERKNIGSTYYGRMRVSVRQSTYLVYRMEGWRKSLAKYWGVG